jgi:hemerythrin-like domain-containing protein
MHQLHSGAPADVAAWRDLVGLCEQWVDRAHVLKEEQGLFPLLRARGLGPEITVVAALLAQHQTGQAFLRELRQAVERLAAGDASARRDVALWARDYIELVKEHMRIEDQYFYGLADDSLSSTDDAALLEKFEQIDRAVGGSDEERRRWSALFSSPGTSTIPH